MSNTKKVAMLQLNKERTQVEVWNDDEEGVIIGRKDKDGWYVKSIAPAPREFKELDQYNQAITLYCNFIKKEESEEMKKIKEDIFKILSKEQDKKQQFAAICLHQLGLKEDGIFEENTDILTNYINERFESDDFYRKDAKRLLRHIRCALENYELLVDFNELYEFRKIDLETGEVSKFPVMVTRIKTNIDTDSVILKMGDSRADPVILRAHLDTYYKKTIKSKSGK